MITSAAKGSRKFFWPFLLILTVLLIVNLTGCGRSSSNGGVRNGDTLYLAVPVPADSQYDSYDYRNGIELAKEKISGMALPVALELLVDTDGRDIAGMLALAQGYAENPDIIGVIGHLGPGACAQLAEFYRQEQQTLIIPTVSAETVEPEGEFVFRNLPGDQQAAQSMCDRAQSDGRKRMAIYYPDATGAYEMAGFLEKTAKRMGIEIIDRVAEPSTDLELAAIKRRWDAMGYDGVFCAGGLDTAERLSSFLRMYGATGTVYCHEQMAVRDPGTGTALFSLLPGGFDTGEMESFHQDYTARYGEAPTIWAMQAYDSIMTAVRGIASYEVRTSRQLAEYLRSETHNGLFGAVNFRESGEVSGRLFYLRVGRPENLEDGELE